MLVPGPWKIQIEQICSVDTINRASVNQVAVMLNADLKSALQPSSSDERVSCERRA